MNAILRKLSHSSKLMPTHISWLINKIKRLFWWISVLFHFPSFSVVNCFGTRFHFRRWHRLSHDCRKVSTWWMTNRFHFLFMSCNESRKGNIKDDMKYNTACLKNREKDDHTRKTNHALNWNIYFHNASYRRKEVSNKEVIRKWSISFRSSDQL